MPEASRVAPKPNGESGAIKVNVAHEGQGMKIAQNLLDERYATNNKGYPATANWGVLRDVGATYGTEVRFQF